MYMVVVAQPRVPDLIGVTIGVSGRAGIIKVAYEYVLDVYIT